MDFVKRYCHACNGIHPHVHNRQHTGPARVFLAAVTVGFSELANTHYYMCTNCKYKSSKEVI